MTSDSFRRWRITFVHTLLYRAVLLVPSLLPARLAVAIACRVGRVKYRSMRPRLDAQSSNMQRRLQVSADVTQRVLRRSYELEACEVLEGALARFRPKAMLDLTEIRGLENLTAALEGGKGAILYSGHIRGNFSFFPALGALGYKPNIIRLQLREAQNPVKRWLTDHFNRLLEDRFACRFLWTLPDSFGVAVQAAN